jgi:hypothetical protein
MYDMYIHLWLAKDAWWWDTFGADGVFDVYDFIGVILYREGKSFLDNIMTEAAVRAFYGSCQAAEGYYGGNCPGNTPYAVLNWIGDASYSANTYYASISGGKSPELAVKIYSYISTIAAQYAANRFRNPPGAWKTGLEMGRPYHWGNLSLYPREIQKFIDRHRDYVFIFVESLPLGKSFFVPSGCVWAHWLNGIGQGYNTDYSCPIVPP